MSRRIFSKPLSNEGRANYDKIDWSGKLIEPVTDEDALPSDSGRSDDAGSGELAGGSEDRVAEENDGR